MHRLLAPAFAALLVIAVVAVATGYFGAIHLVLAYLFFAVLALDGHDRARGGGISPLFSLQIALVFAIGVVLITLVVGGFGLRGLELTAVLLLVALFVLADGEIGRTLPTTVPYIGAFLVLFGLFLYHGGSFGAGSGMGLFPVLAGIVLAFNCFVLPRYLSEDAVYWSVALLSGIASALALATVVSGEFSVWRFEARTWGEVTYLGRELPVVRSVFANPNTFGLLAFPGVVASALLVHRSLGSGALGRAGLATIAFGTSALGLVLSNSRASVFAAGVALAIYGSFVLKGRQVLPGAIVATAVAIPGLLLAMYLSVLPIDPANRFALWEAGLQAVRHDSGLLGQGIVGTREALEPYSTRGETVHNSYLSIAIRTGVVGGVAYGLLVLGPLAHAARRIDTVSVGMLALAIGFAVHQLFEGYTLFQLGHGSIIGALALGYVITSLADDVRAVGTPADARRPDERERATEPPAPGSPVGAMEQDD
ncbi:O-antigen ligase family protein [Halalkalicoccus tibetensis]|uniref:O-antigen ligase family protein n=1 Tax=Halalkalicoccus tibetensis TaxID=175632 RepID=A0ABD5V2J3_9EURY